MGLEIENSEEKIVDNYKTDTLYTHKFKNEAGKYFTIVSRDENGVPDAIEVEHPYPVIRNKIKTTFTFIKQNNEITNVSFKRFKFYKTKVMLNKMNKSSSLFHFSSRSLDIYNSFQN